MSMTTAVSSPANLITLPLVQCSHWSACGVNGGGCCDLGLYGGRPSFGVCLQHCGIYDGPPDRAARIAAVIGHYHAQSADNGRMRHGCGTKIHVWLGMRWIGWPWPLRLRLRRRWWPIMVEQMPGCGCLVKGRAATIALRNAWRYWRRA